MNSGNRKEKYEKSVAVLRSRDKVVLLLIPDYSLPAASARTFDADLNLKSLNQLGFFNPFAGESTVLVGAARL